MLPLIPTKNKRRGSKMLAASALLLAMVGFSACQMTSADRGNAMPAAPSATFSFCDNEASGCSGETSFSTAATRDLEVKVSWQNVPAGNHVQTLEILIPSGDLYQQTQMAFGVAQVSTEPLVAIQTLPVAGTWIQQRSMTGEWTARVSLDGQVIATQTVQLTP